MGLALDLEDCHPSVLLHCWLGHLTCKIVSEMTYNVSSGTLNPTVHSADPDPYRGGGTCPSGDWKTERQPPWTAAETHLDGLGGLRAKFPAFVFKLI